ncbi:hypothetical protein GCM10010172_30000 [Paractinoplanes ferrugineus]|uniref:Uncharacterized protein n=1 Tax=Paractinoplanes ferrugineus TaxID=113564 RepID=A0A919J8C1_9ACTN|nr:hypothetical protein Afe05nite_74750 [Actinoplanes ferrugineus]
MLLEHPGDLIKREEAMPRETHMLHPFSTTFVSEPSRRHTKQVGDLLNRVPDLPHVTIRLGCSCHHCGISDTSLEKLFEVTNTQLGGKLKNRRTGHGTATSSTTTLRRPKDDPHTLTIDT